MGGMIPMRFGQRESPRTKPGTAKRTLAFVAPYAGQLGLLLLVVVLNAAIDIVNPLVYRDIINNGILKGNSARVIQLASLVGGLGVLSGAFGLAQSYLSTKIGACIVLRLRTSLFEHIQQMPLAFFTRTQTGALVSRLDNDVDGTGVAFTGILSNSIGNFVIVILIVSAMFALSWRITLAALILPPLLILPARFWGRKLQAITRERLDLAASMNNFMVERFNVAGAQLAKLFGQRQCESKAFEANATRVSDIGVKSAVYGRLLFSALFLMTSFATALAYGWGGVLAVKYILDVGT